MNFKLDEYWNYWVLINDSGFALDSSDIDLWNLDLIDTHTFRFVRYRYPHFFVSKTSWRCFQDMSSGRLQDMSSRRFQDMPSSRLQDMSSRRLQDVFSITIFRLRTRLQDVLRDVFKTPWKTKNCCAEDVLKTSSKHVLKTSSEPLEDQQMFAGEFLITVI